MMRPLERMPRSLMRTTTDPLVFWSTTRTMLPNGRVGWQAVMAYMSNRSPLAVRWPLRTAPYHDAMPWSLSSLEAAAGFNGACITGVALKMGEGGGAVEAGLGSPASACTVGVTNVNATAASATEEAPARIQFPMGLFKLRLRDFLRITIRLFY